MNKIEELKKRIYKHCPELKKLSKGCRIKIKDFGTGEFSDHWINGKAPIHHEDSGYLVIKHGMGWNGRYADFHTVYEYSDGKKVYNKDVEILGHPIHLEHVLRAIAKSNVSGFYIDRFGQIEAKGQYEDMPVYIFSKSFEENCENPELVDFLLEVIKQNEN